MIIISVRDEHFGDPADDELGRSHFGYSENMTPEQIYEGSRGCWVLGSRADREDIALIAHAGTVVLAVGIDQLVTVPDSGRRAIEGRILDPAHPIHQQYVGKPSPAGRSRNPIRYIEAPRPEGCGCGCGCGCGEPVTNKDFLPGHDQRAIHDRVSQVGTVLDFVHWFDQTFTASRLTG